MNIKTLFAFLSIAICVAAQAQHKFDGNESSINLPSSSNDEEFRRRMIKNLHAIAFLEFDEKMISKLMEWPAAVKVSSDERKTVFNFIIYRRLNNPRVGIAADGKSRNFEFSIASSYFCLTGEDVAVEFGNDFSKLLSNREIAYGTDVARYNSEMNEYYNSKNFQRFGDGLFYERRDPKTQIMFSARLNSKGCVDRIFIGREKT